MDRIETYDNWNKIKKHLDSHGRSPRVRAGEIYWVGIGQNIGAEIYGKGSAFARPVLILKKINHHTFIGIPLTSKTHQGPNYVNFKFGGVWQFAILGQIRTFSIKRLYRRMGRIDELDFEAVRKGLGQFLGY